MFKSSKDDKGQKNTDDKKSKSDMSAKDKNCTKVKVDFDPEVMMTSEDLNYLFDNDLSEVDQYVDLIEQCYNQLQEELTVRDRLLRRAAMRRNREKIRIARVRALRRRAVQSKILKRAKRSAIERMKLRFSGGRDPENLTYSEKERIERMVHKRQAAVNRIARRLVRQKRELEIHRLQHRPTAQ